MVFGEVESGIKVLDRMKSVTLLEPKRDGKPAPDQRVSRGVSCYPVLPVLTAFYSR